MGQKLPKRPRDFNEAAKLVIDIGTGQVADREPAPPEDDSKDPPPYPWEAAAASRAARHGGCAVPAERRSEIAHKAAKKRWKRD
jgi:hypothetical protein